jgi:hypothetical protein
MGATLPSFNSVGDLPVGMYHATLSEVLRVFGGGSEQRQRCARNLAHVFSSARRTGHLLRLLIFGSFVTEVTYPNDVDVVLIMDDAFRLEDCQEGLSRWHHDCE